MSDERSPLSILHLLAPAPFGGLETVVTTLAAGQAQAGDRVTVALVLSDGEEDHPIVSAPGMGATEVVMIHAAARSYVDERRKVRRLIQEMGCDVVHTHGYRPDVIDAPVARSLGVPTVTTVHGFTARSWRGHLNEWLQKRSFRKFDAVVTVSDQMRAELIDWGLEPARVRTVKNAWAPAQPPRSRGEARAILGLPDEAPVVGWVGRMSAEKAPDIMLQAFAALEGADAHLSMVGDGPMVAELAGEPSGRDASARVHWHGAIPEAGRLLTAFDALALTSWTEGTPMILLEAMAAGVPIVTTAVGGVPKVVSDEEAILVEAGDVGAFAEALHAVLHLDPVAARTRAEAAEARLLADFAVEPWISTYREIYDGCGGRPAT